MNKTHAIIRFIIALAVLAGIISVFWWANCSDRSKTVNYSNAEKECAGGPSKVEHGEVIAWDTARNYPQKDEMVTFEGYVVMPNMTYLNGGTYMVNLYPDSTLSGDYVTVMVYEGDCENTMEPIPDDYDDSDLLIYDNSAKEIVHGDKIRVTGKVFDTRMMYIFIAKRIEKM